MYSHRARDYVKTIGIIIWREYILHKVVRQDGCYNTGMMVYAWYIFERGYIGKTEIDWIDNNNDVLKK